MTPRGWNRDASPFHAGEQNAQRRAGVREKMEQLGRRVVRDYFPEEHREFYERLPFLVVATTDAKGRPWVSLLTGPPGFITSPDPRQLRIETKPLFGSPLAGELAVDADVGLLGILPENRRRNRSTGRIVAVDETGLTIAIHQTFGNCPQYIQTRELELLPGIATPEAGRPIETGQALDAEGRGLISRADTLFLATSFRPDAAVADDSPQFGADASHRGGKPGFVRVEDERTIVFPDFSGNFHFNTVGNMLENPAAGFLFIDFDSRDLLYLNGRAEVIWEGPELAAFAGAERLIRLHVGSWRRVRASLPLAFRFVEYSPTLERTGSWEAVDAALALEGNRNRHIEYEVLEVLAESSTIRSVHLRRVDGAPLGPHEPGQFLPLRLTIDDAAVDRVYSLSQAPNPETYRLSIKRESGGLASRFVHDRLARGMRVEALAPRGRFVLDRESRRPVVLLSAGVGVTPMIAMLEALVAERVRTGLFRAVHFIHGARNGAEHAFGARVRALAEANPGVHVHVSYSRPGGGDRLGIDFDAEGRVDIERLKAVLPFDAFDASDFYLCGPQNFMRDLHAGLVALRVPPARIRYESFGPATVFAAKTEQRTAIDRPAEPVKVRFARAGLEAEWTPESGTLLELAEAEGIDAPFSCRSGQCGACATRIQCGGVDYLEEPNAPAAVGEVLICGAIPRPVAGAESCGDAIGVVLDL